MSKKKSKYFKSVEEYREFYAKPPAKSKKEKDKYYQMGIKAANLASENTIKALNR